MRLYGPARHGKSRHAAGGGRGKVVSRGRRRHVECETPGSESAKGGAAEGNEETAAEVWMRAMRCD